jgi:hypothetical protein
MFSYLNFIIYDDAVSIPFYVGSPDSGTEFILKQRPASGKNGTFGIFAASS